MVIQQDFGGPLGGRPACHRVQQAHHRRTTIGSCGIHRGTSLLNVGLVYVRASPPGGGALACINGTWSGFLALLGRSPKHVEMLIDQPLMRSVVERLSISEPGKPARSWTVVPGAAAEVYSAGGVSTTCMRDNGRCNAVASERARTAFLAQLVRPPPTTMVGAPAPRAERIALAPDWLFGRGCLLHVREPLALLEMAGTGASARRTQCVLPPTEAKLTMPAPGPAAGLLVATHFVYSMALKRKRTFKSFAWDVADRRNRTAYPTPGSCWQRSRKGMLLGHTFFSQLEAKAVLCAMPAADGPECACCEPIHSLEPQLTQGQSRGRHRSHAMETTAGWSQGWGAPRAVKLQQGCADYQMFWD